MRHVRRICQAVLAERGGQPQRRRARSSRRVLFAANGVWGHFYIFCWSDPSQSSQGSVPCTGAPSGWSGAGGTSFAAPIMAGVQALINQHAGARQGNPNYRDDDNLGDLRRQAMRWTMDHIEALKTATPEMPAGFDNRLSNNWQLLLAIADIAGGEWPEKARQAALAVDKVLDAGDVSVSVRLFARYQGHLHGERHGPYRLDRTRGNPRRNGGPSMVRMEGRQANHATWARSAFETVPHLPGRG